MGTGLYLKRADTARYYLGPQGSPMLFQGGEHQTWFQLGELPIGSLLKSVTADVMIEYTDTDGWASDLTFALWVPASAGALLQIGGYWNIQNVVNRLYWTSAGDNYPPTRFTDRKLAGVDFPEGLDLHDTEVWIANAYGAISSFSGTVDFTWVPTA